ncbi:MAG: Ig-like domain repeat protein [Aquabacterium sp.]
MSNRDLDPRGARARAFLFGWRCSSALLVSALCASSAWANTTTTLTVSPANILVGQPVTLSSTVTNTAVFSVNVTKVTFRDNNTIVGAVMVSNGQASLSLPAYTAAGQHNYTATYNDSGSIAYPPKSVSPTVTSTARFATTTALSSSSTSTRGGSAVTFTAAVSGGTPTGIVAFLDGNTSIGTVSVSGGTAKLTTSLTTAGTHNISAVYNGSYTDQTTMSSTSGTVNVSVSGRDYFVDAVNGGSSNPGTQTAPWADLSSVNNAALSAGNNVYFANGSVWSGTLVPKSGATYGNYVGLSGSSTLPVISGSVNVGSGAGLTWQLMPNSNIYRALVSNLIGLAGTQSDARGNAFTPAITQLILNGNRLQRARYPQVGGGTSLSGQKRYLQIQSAQRLSNSTVANVTPTQSVPTSNLVTFNGDLPSNLAVSDLVGAEVYARNFDWYLDHYTVTQAAIGSQDTLTVQADPFWPSGTDAFQATLCVVDPCSGYWLENKLWMLTQPGQWVYDPSGPYLYVRMPDNSSPASASNLRAAVYANAVGARNVSSVTIKNLTFADTRYAGVALFNVGSSLNISGVTVRNAGSQGIAVSSNGALSNSAISGSTVSNSVNEGINLGWADTVSLAVTGNTVTNAGRGYFASSAIQLGHGSVASSNHIQGSSYIGLHMAKSNTVTNNWIESSCMEFNDCGGIYVRGLDYAGTSYGLTYDNDVSSTISGNFVEGTPAVQAPDRLDGMFFGNVAVPNASATNGIYLDDYTGAATVSGNFVSNFDLGVMLHLARMNTVQNNTLVGNVRGIRMQENNNQQSLLYYCKVMLSDTSATPALQPHCDSTDYIYGNVISGNAMASSSGQPIIVQDSDFGSTSDFASYSNNLYATFNAPRLVNDGASSLTLAQWKLTGKDTGSSVYATADAYQVNAGATNMLNNGNFTNGVTGWLDWQAVTNGVNMTVSPTGCDPGNAASACLVADALYGSNTTSIFYTHYQLQPLSLQLGQAYSVSFDAKVATPGSTAPYVETVFADPFNFATLTTSTPRLQLSGNWQQEQVVLVANQTTASARLNLAFFTPSSISLANVRVLPVTPVVSKAQPVGFYAAMSPKVINCPNADGSNCANYMDLRTHSALQFPLTLSVGQSLLAVVNNPKWVDTDNDGVPGDGSATGADACANTVDGASVGLTGCAINQTPSH